MASRFVRTKQTFGARSMEAPPSVPQGYSDAKMRHGEPPKRIAFDKLSAAGGQLQLACGVTAGLPWRVLTDPPESRRWDRVFPIYADETALLAERVARYLQRNSGAEVADLGTGSGLLGIVAAQRASHVVAVDLSRRALMFAMHNARLNCTVRNLEFVEGCWWAPLNRQRFDLVMINPPFVPTPPGVHRYLCADGGPRGDDGIVAALRGLPDHLNSDGRLLAVSVLLGNCTYPDVRRVMRDAGILDEWVVRWEPVYPTPLRVERLLRPVYETNGWPVGNLIERLTRDGLTHAHYVLMEVHRGGNRNVRVQRTAVGTRWHGAVTTYSGGWQQRVSRMLAGVHR